MDKKQNGGKPPSQSTTINIPTTRQQHSLNKNKNSPTTATSIPIPIPDNAKSGSNSSSGSLNKKTGISSKTSPIPTPKVSSTSTSSGSIGDNNSSSANKIKKPQPSMSISPNSGFTKPSSAPSTFGGGMLSRMQQQQQHLLRNQSNNPNHNSIISSNSGFLRPVGIPISSSFNQSKSNNNNNNNILKMSDNSASSYSSNSSISPRNHYSGSGGGSNRNVMMSTSSDSSTSTSPNFSGFMNKQSPNSYYSGFGIPSSFSSSSSPTSSSPIGGSSSNHGGFPKPSPSNIYLRPSPPGSFHTPQSHNSFLMPSPQSASEVYGSKNSNQTFSSLPVPPNNQPKTKTIGFDVSSSSSTSSSSSSSNKTTSTTTTTTTSSPTPTKNRTRRSTSLLLYGSLKEEQTIPAHDLEFDSQDSDGSENGDDFFDDDDDYKHREDNDHLLKSPPPKEISSHPLIKNNNNNNSNNSNNNNNSNIGNSKASFVNIENLDSLGVERIVMEGWKKQIPRFHQKDACVKILQNIVEQFKIDSKKIVPLSPATPHSTPHSPLSSSNIMSAPSSTNSDYSNYSNTTTTTNNSTYNQQQQHNNQVIKPIKNAKNYLIQHAPGSGKSHTIACLVTNLYRLLEDHKLKYDLILILNDKRHLDIQLGSIITQFLKDNELTSIIHPSTIALLEKILIKAKTRVVITTVQKFTTIIERESGKFEQISSKYKSIAIVSDDLKTMSDRFSSILTSSETREANNITYFCFTSTPKPKILELFGDTRGNLRVPFHTYSIEKALQDKTIMNVIDNYTTVAILTKVSNESASTTTNNNNNNNSIPSDKSSYHILKHSNNDKKIIQEKSSYIIKHFIKLREQINNEDFNCRSILVASSREQILLYKTTLETLIKALPKNQRFDVIASFSRFELKKKEKAEYDEKINGNYAHYFEKRNGISEIIKNDTKHRVQLIIVADKLQTGFDEPSLAVMYVDRPLKGSTAVQTIGRLSRVAKGKSACYVVDFINTRRDISDAFGQYWRETCLKGATRKTVLEKKLTRTLGKLSLIEPLANGRLEESVEYILKDDEKRKKERKVGSITDDITQYFELCNQLLWDNAPPMNTKFLELVKFHVCEKRLSSQMTSIRGLLQNIENKSTILNQQQQQQQLQQQQIILPDSSVNLINASVINSGGGSNKKQLPTRKLSNSQYFYQDAGGKLSSIKQESGKFDYQMKQEEEMDLDAENLEFAREIWSSNPEIKLHSRLLGNDKDEDEMDDIGFNLKMFENAETIEQVIGIVVEFVSRNGQTFENVIQNQSMSAIFPFIDPQDSNYPIYKSKLDKARVKFNAEQQKLIQLQLKEQQQYKEQQLHHVQQLKEQQIYNNIHHHHNHNVGSSASHDVIMGESYGQIQFQLQTPWNNQDIPLPVPLPVITIDQVVGKPHAKGKLTDDCLLDDCVLSFCNDLDTKDPNDAPLRVYAIKVLGMLTNKGIHKNTLHEIVGSIHKILLNPKESISIKMIALDLLALVASQDEVTITQILDFGLIVTIVKLIESAEEPLKAKCCKFFSVLHDEVAIVSALIECQGISVITQLLESYDYLLVEQALRCLVALSTEDRTIKMIRTSMDPNVVSRLEHHKIQVIHDLINQLKSLISGSKRTLQQFQPLLTSKRIRSNSNSQKKSLDSSSSSVGSGIDVGLSKSSNIIKNSDGGNSISLSNSSPNVSIPNLISPPLVNNDDDSSSGNITTTTTTTPTPIQTRSRSILSTL